MLDAIVDEHNVVDKRAWQTQQRTLIRIRTSHTPTHCAVSSVILPGHRVKYAKTLRIIIIIIIIFSFMYIFYLDESVQFQLNKFTLFQL